MKEHQEAHSLNENVSSALQHTEHRISRFAVKTEIRIRKQFEVLNTKYKLAIFF